MIETVLKTARDIGVPEIAVWNAAARRYPTLSRIRPKLPKRLKAQLRRELEENLMEAEYART